MTKTALRKFLFESEITDLLKKTSYLLCAMLVVSGIPFMVMDVLRGSHLSALTLFGMVIAAAFNVWTIKRHNVYYPIVTLAVIFPLFLWFDYDVTLNQGIIGILWSFPFLIGFYFTLPERMSWLASVIGVSLTTFAAFQTFDTSISIRVFLSTSMVCFCIALLTRIINRQNIDLQQQASQDPLTGLLNRKLLQSTLESAIDAHNTKNTPTTILCMDLDGFKQVNDTYGHHVGDAVLTSVADLLKQFAKKHLNHKKDQNVLFRTGGEEFLVVLHNIGVADATKIAENLREIIATQPILPDQNPVTASFGISQYKTGSTWTQWINHADNKMYQAKDSGRNCVIAHAVVV